MLLKGQLEAARAEGLSAQRQWAAEQQQLKRTAQELWAELQRCHESLTQTVGQVRVLQAAACCRWLLVPPGSLGIAAETGQVLMGSLACTVIVSILGDVHGAIELCGNSCGVHHVYAHRLDTWCDGCKRRPATVCLVHAAGPGAP